MSKAFFHASFSAILAFLVIITPSYGQVGPKNGDTWTPRLPGPAPAVPNPLVVTDVVVDKEAANAVVAREQAMADSRRAAFMKLAERNMSPEAFKSYKPPKDSDIAMLVQDFEVQDEQMSATRYVGTFTVRFRDNVRNYIDVHTDPSPPPSAQAAYVNDRLATMNAAAEKTETDPALPPETAAVAPPVDPGYPEPAPADGSGRSWKEAAYGAQPRPSLLDANGAPIERGDNDVIAKSVLIVPYYEDISGETLLWEETNPWLPAWQGALPRANGGGRKFFVPLGDISDIAAGAANGVWSGNYAPLDRLMRNYGAEQAVLAVANKSGPQLTVEIYTYREGRLRRRDTLKPYVGDKTQTEALRTGVFETVAYLQAPAADKPRPVRRVEQISHDLLATPSYAIPANNPDNYATTVIDSKNDGYANRFGNNTGAQMNNRPPLVVKPVQDFPPGYIPPAQQPAYSNIASQPQLGSATRLDARMDFTDGRAWMELQRRIAGAQPPVRVNISSLSSSSVTFTLASDAPLPSVQQALSARGVDLQSPAGEYGGAPVYNVRLAP